jgi:ATP-dependent helicase HrpA
VLVFLPGEREIREAAEALRKHHPPGLEVLPLFARQTAVEQGRVFASHQGRRVVLATNVAETSLTVPGIRYVIDSGLARVKRYSHRNKVEQLQVEPISRAAASQRAGRCGRVSAGVCFKLYDEDDFNKRPPYTEPEILRSSLAGVILRMKSLASGRCRGLPFPRSAGAAHDCGWVSAAGGVGRDNGRAPSTNRSRRSLRTAVTPFLGKGGGGMALDATGSRACSTSARPEDRPHDPRRARARLPA